MYRYHRSFSIRSSLEISFPLSLCLSLSLFFFVFFLTNKNNTFTTHNLIKLLCRHREEKSEKKVNFNDVLLLFDFDARLPKNCVASELSVAKSNNSFRENDHLRDVDNKNNNKKETYAYCE